MVPNGSTYGISCGPQVRWGLSFRRSVLLVLLLVIRSYYMTTKSTGYGVVSPEGTQLLYTITEDVNGYTT